MYWKVDEYKDVTDRTWYIYNYISFVTVNPPKTPYYNGILKTTVYPANVEMVVKAVIASPQEDVSKLIK